MTTGDEDLQALYAAVSEALRTGAERVQKQLWRHNLHLGTTRISMLDDRGQERPRPAHQDSVRFIEALALGLEELDRDGAILKR